MAFEFYRTTRDPLYPMTNDQDERILVEFNGIIHSEAEDLFYGMKDCPILEIHDFNTYNRLRQYDSDKVYEEIGYFRPRDLITYLNDGNELPEDEVNTILEYANFNYDYKTATFLNMTGALSNLMSADYLKGITFVMPNHRHNDYLYLMDMFDNKLLNEKAQILEIDPDDDLITKIKEEIKVETTSQTPYTTVITNEYLLILDILKEYKEYNASTMLFLLRNHSQNMEQLIKGDHISFIEKYTDQIIGAINGDVSKSKLENLDFPVKAKFGRFSPVPFSTGSPSFMTFGDTENDIEVEQSP